MKRLIILTNNYSEFQRNKYSRFTINYINRPTFNRGNFKFKMNLKKGLYFITNLFAPYFYYKSTGSISSVGFGYSEVVYGELD